MDLETLRRYQQYKAAAAALSDEIDSMYYRPSAASFEYHADHADLAGPTVRILDNIENRKEKLRLLLADYVALAEEIEDWLETVEDPQIQAICRYRFILGKQWNEISRIVCGSLDESTSRSILRRYLNSQGASAGSSEEPSSGSGKESAAKAGKALR